MRAIALGLALLAIGFAVADQIVVKHVRPSKLVALLNGGQNKPKVDPHPGIWVSSGVALIPYRISSLKADDAHSALIVEGSAESIDEFRKIINEFDIAPHKVSVKITIQSPADKYESTTITELNNNSLWTLKDETSGIDLTLAARINGDGTLIGTFRVGNDSIASSMMTRLGNRTPIRFKVSGDGKSLNQLESKNGEATGTDILVTVTFDLKDLPNQRTTKPAAKH